MAATEQKIIYELLETIRNSENTDDDKMTERVLRQYLYDYRNAELKNLSEVSEEVFQKFTIDIHKEGKYYVSGEFPDIIFDKSRYGISIFDFDVILPVTSKEEALTAQKSRFYVPAYISYIDSEKLYIIVNSDALMKLDNDRQYLLNLLNQRKLEIRCILSDPSKGTGYDWKKSKFPMMASSIKNIRQNILRQEFGIMQEVKKDEVQNGRADNIIYQDESKLLK